MLDWFVDALHMSFLLVLMMDLVQCHGRSVSDKQASAAVWHVFAVGNAPDPDAPRLRSLEAADRAIRSCRSRPPLQHPPSLGGLRFDLEAFSSVESIGGICGKNAQLDRDAFCACFLRLHFQDNSTNALPLKWSVDIELADKNMIGLPDFGDAANGNTIAFYYIMVCGIKRLNCRAWSPASPKRLCVNTHTSLLQSKEISGI
nr:hypothetical protein [Sphingomonas panacis]